MDRVYYPMSMYAYGNSMLSMLMHMLKAKHLCNVEGGPAAFYRLASVR